MTRDEADAILSLVGTLRDLPEGDRQTLAICAANRFAKRNIVEGRAPYNDGLPMIGEPPNLSQQVLSTLR